VGGSLLLVLLGLAGCGKGNGQVSGWVTWNGQPVSSGSVLMIGRDGIPAYGTIQPDGSYTIKRLRTGVVKVAVTSPAPLAPVPAKGAVGTKFHFAGNASAAPAAGWFPIPEKYGDPETADLTFEVKKGLNSFDIDLR
jgi:hypothetical protein